MNGFMSGKQVHYTAILKLVAVLTLALLLNACGSTPTTISGAVTPRTEFNQQDYEAALELMKKKKYTSAIVLLETIVRDDTKRVGPFINLGIAYKELGKFDDSKRALITATQVDRSSAIAFNELGLVYRKLGEFTSAKKAYMKSIDNNSRYSLPYRNLGILCDIYLQDMSCAIRNYKKYQSLTRSKDKKVELWIVDLKRRMGNKSRGK
ncbi:MAG: tetratricopeptide repeat protein [Acidiferrobacterales bacterium]